MTATIRKITAQDAGCWIEDRHGWQVPGLVIGLAQEYGFTFDAVLGDEERAALALYMANDRDAEGYGDAWEVVNGQGGLVYQAEEHLDSLAPGGFHFVLDGGLSLVSCDQITGHDPSDCI